MKHATLALISALALSSTSVFATNPYISFGGGFVLPGGASTYHIDSSNIVAFSPSPDGTGLFVLENIDFDGKYKRGYALDFAIGGALNPCMRLEGEFLYQNLKRQMSGSYDLTEVEITSGDVFLPAPGVIPNNSRVINIYSLLFNGYLDFKNNTPMTPFIGAGLGVAWIRSGDTHGDTIVSVTALPAETTTDLTALVDGPSLSGTTFAWQLKAGIDFSLSCDFDITLQYRLFGTTRYKSDDTDITLLNSTTGESATFNVAGKRLRGFINNELDLNFIYRF